MLFKKSPDKFWNLIASKYAASPIAVRTAYEMKIQKIKTNLTPSLFCWILVAAPEHNAAILQVM